MDTFKFKNPIPSFINIDKIRIINKIQLKETLSLLRIFSKEDFKKVHPTNITKKEIIKDEIYSYLPCPLGCSLSGGLIERLNANKFIKEDAESDRLLKASAVIEILFKTNPINNFIKNKMKFRKILI